MWGEGIRGPSRGRGKRRRSPSPDGWVSRQPGPPGAFPEWPEPFFDNMGGPPFPNPEYYGNFAEQAPFALNPRGNGHFQFDNSEVGREDLVPDYFHRYRRNPTPRELGMEPVQPMPFNMDLRNPDRETGNMNWWGQGDGGQDRPPHPEYSRMSTWGTREDSRFDRDNSRFDRDNSRFDRDNSRFDRDNSRFDRNDSRYGRDDSRYGRDDSRYDRNNSRYDRNNSRYDRDNSRYDQDNSQFNKRARRREKRRRRLPRHILESFCEFIRSNEAPKSANAIQTIENGLTSSKLDVKTEFYCEELEWYTEKALFTGTLSLSGVFLSRAEGGNKKTVKHEAYQKALNVIMEKSVDEILKQRDRGPDDDSVNLVSQTSKSPNLKEKKMLKAVMDVATNIAEMETDHYKTSAEGFKKLIAELRSNRKLYNEMSSISLIEQSMTTSRCGLLHRYEAKNAEFLENELPFHGTFFISNKVIAKGMGYNKKKAKDDTYEKAYKNLLTKHIEEILEGLPEHEDVEIEEDWRVRIRMAKTVPANTEVIGLKKKLDETIDAVQNATPSKNIVKSLDFVAIFQGFSPLCVYSDDENLEGKHTILCELYFDDIFIASGEGDTKEDSEKNTYLTAWQVLCTITSGTISKFHKHLSEDECTHPAVIDIIEKGSARSAASNISQLKQQNIDINEEWKIPSALVIVEQPEWEQNRKNHCFSILKYSAMENGMLCQWNVHADSDGDGFKCTVFLQDEVVGTASAGTKTTARNLAFADALFRFYENNDVIRILKRDLSISWMPWSEVVQKAEEMKKEEMGELSEPTNSDSIEPVDTKESTENKEPTKDKDYMDGKADIEDKDDTDGKADTEDKDDTDGKADTEDKDDTDGKADTEDKDDTDGKADTEDKKPMKAEPLHQSMAVEETEGSKDAPSTEIDAAILQSESTKQDHDVATHLAEEELAELDPCEEPPANKWIIRAAEEIIKSFFDSNQDLLEELAIGPGLNNAELKGIEGIAHSLDFKLVTRQHESRLFIAIHRPVSPRDIVVHLRENEGKSKRYTLVSRDSLPKHADIEAELARYSQLQSRNVDSYSDDDSNESADDDVIFVESIPKPGQNGSKRQSDEDEMDITIQETPVTAEKGDDDGMAEPTI